MSLLSSIPIIGKVLEGVFGIIDKSTLDKDKAAALKADIQLKMMSMDHEEVSKLIEARSQIIVAEIKSGWLTRNWRPTMMMVFIFIIFNDMVLLPYLTLFGVPGVKLSLPPEMWDLLKIGTGGYVLGRSAEKGIKEWKKDK